MLIISMLVFFAVIFLLAAITVAIAWMAFVKETAEETEAAAEEAAGDDEGAPQTHPIPSAAGVWDEDSPLFRSDRLSTVRFWDNLLNRFDFVEKMRARMEEAGVDWSVGRLTLAMLLSGTVTMLLLSRFVPSWAPLAGLAAGFIPYAYVLRLRQNRFRKLREAFPDALDSLARAMRAGYPLGPALEMVAAEAAPPLNAELQRTSTEANLGMGWPRALENLGKRVPLLEVNLFSSAVTLHSRTGGRLSEVLVGLAENMREANALHGEVRALSAHGRLTGAILTILPMGIAGMMMVVSPQYMLVLIHHPWGGNLIGAAIGCLVVAHFVIRRLVDIKL
jgi:tight adherence protein B